MLNPAILILDFNPILNRDWIKYLNCKIYEIDSHNILPTRYASEEKEYSAATFRRKIYYGIYPFLTNYSNFIEYQSEADLVLEDFIQNKLERYAEDRNNPNKNVLSNLSKYLNLGFISSQRIAIDVIKSKVPEINKEVFLEELIVRKELADNFCHYCKDYKSLNCAYAWARNSLINHSQDLRKYIYSKNQLEKGETHDRLWNATQQQLIQEGTIHGYLRMYWAKKIMEWSLSAKEALETGIYLNDKYGYDAPSSNGYVGLLWAIAGIHDRAFMDFEVTGKIRRMSYNSLKKKIDVDSYIKTLTNKVTE